MSGRLAILVAVGLICASVGMLAVDARFTLDDDLHAGRSTHAGDGSAIWGVTLDKRSLLGLARARDFRELGRRLEALQTRAESDIAGEPDAYLAFTTFHVTDPAIGDALAAWLEAEPDSWAAHTAWAQHQEALGREQRGGRLAAETSEAQFRGMREHFARAVPHAEEAVRRRPTALAAYGVLIAVAQAEGEQRRCVAIADRALAAVPASFETRRDLMACLLPRWGGSYVAMDAVAREAARHLARNPRLAALRGMPDLDRGRVFEREKRTIDALRFYAQALDTGPHWEFLLERGDLLVRSKQYERALLDLDRALTLRPQSASVLDAHARALLGLQRYGDAQRDIELLVEVDPTDRRAHTMRTRVAEGLLVDGWKAYEAKDTRRAIDRLEAAERLAPGETEAQFWIGRVRLAADDFVAAERAFRAQIAADPHHFESLRNLDYLLARRGEWDEVVRLWDGFLALEPRHAGAFLERAGTQRHRGDLRAALADLNRACGLGSDEACKLADRGYAVH